MLKESIFFPRMSGFTRHTHVCDESGKCIGCAQIILPRDAKGGVRKTTAKQKRTLRQMSASMLNVQDKQLRNKTEIQQQRQNGSRPPQMPQNAPKQTRGMPEPTLVLPNEASTVKLLEQLLEASEASANEA